MADYSKGGPNGHRSSDPYANPQGSQREAAFSNIFGAAPPPGRSQTMNSSVAPPGVMYQGRTQTMSSGPSGGMPRHPQPRPSPGGGYHSPQLPPMSNGGGMSNGFPQSPRQLPPGQVPSQPQPNYMPGNYRPGPDRRPYPPQRPDPRDQRRPPPQNPQQYQQRPHQGQRPYAGSTGPGPALNSDPFRSQSMAGTRGPPMHSPAVGYSQSPANAFRQAQYLPPQSQTTALGRVVPERGDERTMSMSSYTRDREHQTQSGRIIPSRRPSNSGTHDQSNGYSESVVRQPATQTRSASMTSTTPSVDTSRTMSMASTISPSTMTDLSHKPSVATSVSSGTDKRRKVPLVYPALLSRVAECLKNNITVGDRTKNGLTYKNAFSGAEAVSVISYIIKTTDSNLALLLGRALDAQKFFHDVTYDHRLRDSSVEMYQFRETMMDESQETPEVNGVFVLLSECYSPTCTRDSLCYSIACPRRLEQQSRLNLKPQPGLRPEEEEVKSLHEAEDEPDEQKLWINTVSKEIADSIGEREKKRQEIISEIMYTERDFVKDLEYLRDFWILPLRSNNPATPSPIPESRRDRIVRTIFTNIIDTPSIHGVSSRFAEVLTERQKKHPIVTNVGDIFLQFVPLFEPFVVYGSKQLEGKFEFEAEKSLNAAFGKFVDETERRKESRKLELNGYLTKPTTRLARYPLLLEGVLKYTEPGNPDLQDVPEAIKMIRSLLERVNAESGKAENRFNLRRLHEQLRFRPNERVDLKLTDDNREIVWKGGLKRNPADAIADIQTYLFDHALLLVKVRTVAKKEEIKAYRKPIPLELLAIREMEEVMPRYARRPTANLLPGARAITTDTTKKEGFPITFRHLGKDGYNCTLYANTLGSRKKWLESVGSQQQILRQRADFYNKTVLSSEYFTSANRVNCVTPYDGGRKLIYGTDSGVYISDRKAKDAAAKPVRVIDVANVTQVDILEEYQLLLVLSQKSLLSYPLSALDPSQPVASKRSKKIQNHCNFFRTGICLGKHLVCCAKSSAMTTTIKVFEPNDVMSKGKKQQSFKMFRSSENDELKPFKEFYIPTESSSIHFLKTKLCVASARGFEVVSLETLETQTLLDQADTSLDFVAKREGARPVHIERLNGEFLLNYTEFSFFVNRNGWRAKPGWRIDWEGTPTGFALSYPWLLAFEQNFIEIRNIETHVVHIVPHKNIRLLHTSTREILYAYEDEFGHDVVLAIDFWPIEPPLPKAGTSNGTAPSTKSRR